MNNNTIIMPVRKRSPTSGNSTVYTTTQPTFTTTLPENPQTSFQTMRQVNPDGTSTVYHVHDSINNNVGGLPPHVVLGGGGGGGIPLQQQHHIMSQQQAPISGGIVYPYGQQQQQPNIVYVQSDEYSDSDVESDDEESTALVQHNQYQQSPKSKKRIKCCLNSKSTSTICILTSIIFAISFIIGYIFLIDAIVTNNRNNHSSYNNGNQNVMPGSSLRIGSRAYRGGIPSHIQHQKEDEEGGKVYNTPLNTELEEKLGLTEKYYVVKPVISEINVNKLPTSSEGVVVGNNLGGVGNGGVQQQYQRPIQVDQQQHNQLVQEPRNGNVGSGGGSHMKDVVEEQKQQETRTSAGIVPRGSEISRDGPVRRRR